MADPLRPSISRLAHPAGPGGVLGELQSEVSAEATPLLTFMLAHIRTLVAIILLGVTTVVAFGIWHWHSARVERAAQLEFGRILAGQEGKDRLAALENFLASAPSSMKTGVQLEIAASALQMNDAARAAAAYGAVHAGDPRGALGMMAAINQADLLRQAGQPAEALAVLDSLMKTASATLHKTMSQAIRESQAAIAEQTGQLDRALELYEAIVDESGNDERGYYQAKIAELKTRLGESAIQNMQERQNTQSVPGPESGQ